ncbi:MAG TPA: MFS transporter [Candidatus Acetothermia bacterium]|nr:MFS transporter [Candidatus Acetothermia bacterium]
MDSWQSSMSAVGAAIALRCPTRSRIILALRERGSLLVTGRGRYLHHVRHFGKNARWYLLYSALSGFSLGFVQLLFNLYILSLGYDAAQLGILVSFPPLITMAAAVPLGILGHRVGFRRMLLIGVLLMGASLLGIALSSRFLALILFSAVRGISNTVLQVSNAPFMAENSGLQERTHLFSLQFAVRMFANFFGLLLAGVLPGLLSGAFAIDAESAMAYRLVLLMGGGLYSLAWFPLTRTTAHSSTSGRTRAPHLREMLHPPGMLLKLFLPQVVIGFGAGALVPFLNVFFKTRFGLPDATLGLLFAVQSILMGLATLTGPALATRWGKPRAVISVQLLSVPFLGILGYVPLFPLAAVGFLCRAALMNAANPLYTAFAMERVSPHQRGAASAMMQVSWQGTRALSSLTSGYLQQHSGFTFLFPITIVLYTLASGLIYTFFIRGQQQTNPDTSVIADT